MRRLFSKSRKFSALWVLLTLCTLLAATAFGCAPGQDEGSGDQTSTGQASGGQTTVARTATTTQAGTATGAETTPRQETTRQAPREEQQARQQQQAQQQRQQAQQEREEQQAQGQQQGRQGQQGHQETIIVRVTGTEGLSFSDRVGSTQDLQRVEGSVPEEYEIPSRGAAVTATIRKQQPGQGTLGVEVVRDGRVVADRETSAAPGILNVVWTPQRQGN